MAHKKSVFKMKGHTLPGINQKSDGNTAEGRSKSSAFQSKQKERRTLKNTQMLVSYKEKLVSQNSKPILLLRSQLLHQLEKTC